MPSAAAHPAHALGRLGFYFCLVDRHDVGGSSGGGDDSAMKPERRTNFRRQEDALAYEAAQQTERWRHMARRAMIAWAVGMTIAAAALGLEVNQDKEALHDAKQAVSGSNRAVATVGREALGLCRALDVGRISTSRAPSLRRIVHFTFHDAGVLLRSASTRAGLALGHELLQGSRAIRYLPPIDCTALSAHPLIYKLPGPIPFK